MYQRNKPEVVRVVEKSVLEDTSPALFALAFLFFAVKGLFF